MKVCRCRCGCGQRATWLVSSSDYSPEGPVPFEDEPCCDSAKSYMENCAEELDYPVTAERLPTIRLAKGLPQ